MKGKERELLLKAGVFVLLVVLIFALSRYGPQPLAQFERLFEEIEDPVQLRSREEQIKHFLASFGSYSSAMFVLLQAFQVIASPLPGELTGLLGGYIYGQLFGFLLSTIGLSFGSWLAFELARILGRPFVEKFVKKDIVEKFNFLTTNTGTMISFLLFLMPGFPKDYLCYLLGLSPMKLSTFLITCTLGRMPGTYLLTVQGASIRNERYVTAAVVLGISAVVLVIAYLYRSQIFQWVREFRERDDSSA
ncbi:MAG TPA: VTT domain-containing protein [Candidatus Acidoferrales bacterium]|nr:VTT domain-containing protein [Candidatus Acidoferrales bacterium]